MILLSISLASHFHFHCPAVCCFADSY